jgi:hypothetical protein
MAIEDVLVSTQNELDSTQNVWESTPLETFRAAVYSEPGTNTANAVLAQGAGSPNCLCLDDEDTMTAPISETEGLGE